MADNQELPPIKVAFVLDGKVVDILHTDNRLAAIFLSEPLILDVTDLVDDAANSAYVGAMYDAETGTFSLPEEE
jgi:hypothetical protein